MEVICFEDNAFYSLIEKVVDRNKEKNNIKEDKWITGEEAILKMRTTEMAQVATALFQPYILAPNGGCQGDRTSPEIYTRQYEAALLFLNLSPYPQIYRKTPVFSPK
ncbi:MAG: hypothetical protein ABIP95_12930 [Pelobium sp.]